MLVVRTIIWPKLFLRLKVFEILTHTISSLVVFHHRNGHPQQVLPCNPIRIRGSVFPFVVNRLLNLRFVLKDFSDQPIVIFASFIFGVIGNQIRQRVVIEDSRSPLFCPL